MLRSPSYKARRCSIGRPPNSFGHRGHNPRSNRLRSRLPHRARACRRRSPSSIQERRRTRCPSSSPPSWYMSHPWGRMRRSTCCPRREDRSNRRSTRTRSPAAASPNSHPGRRRGIVECRGRPGDSSSRAYCCSCPKADGASRSSCSLRCTRASRRPCRCCPAPGRRCRCCTDRTRLPAVCRTRRSPSSGRESRTSRSSHCRLDRSRPSGDSQTEAGKHGSHSFLQTGHTIASSRPARTHHQAPRRCCTRCRSGCSHQRPHRELHRRPRGRSRLPSRSCPCSRRCSTRRRRFVGRRTRPSPSTFLRCRSRNNTSSRHRTDCPTCCRWSRAPCRRHGRCHRTRSYRRNNPSRSRTSRCRRRTASRSTIRSRMNRYSTRCSHRRRYRGACSHPSACHSSPRHSSQCSNPRSLHRLAPRAYSRGRGLVWT